MVIMKKTPKDPFWDFQAYFNNLMAEMNAYFEQLRKNFEIDIEQLSKDNPNVISRQWGYSYHIGPDGVPHLQTWGDWPEGMAPPQLPLVKTPSHLLQTSETPSVELIEDEDKLRIIAEIPGIDKKHLDLEITETQLRIKGEQETRSYFKELNLPGKIDPDSARASLRNGILEIQAKWKEKPRQKNTKKARGKHIPFK